MTIKSRYEELKQQIHFHNHRYHVLDAPGISDLKLDPLMNELKQIEAEHLDWVTPADMEYLTSRFTDLDALAKASASDI